MGRRIEDKGQTPGADGRPGRRRPARRSRSGAAHDREPDRQRLQVRPAQRDHLGRGARRRRWTTAPSRPAIDLRVRDEGDGHPRRLPPAASSRSTAASRIRRAASRAPATGWAWCSAGARSRCTAAPSGSRTTAAGAAASACGCRADARGGALRAAPRRRRRRRAAGARVRRLSRGSARRCPVTRPPRPIARAELYAEYRQEIWEHTDRMFLWLLAVQWLAGIATALPGRAAPAPARAAVPLAWKAVLPGRRLHRDAAAATWPAPTRARRCNRRQEIAIGQGLHGVRCSCTSRAAATRAQAPPFASLAFLAMYRDARTLLLATRDPGRRPRARQVLLAALAVRPPHGRLLGLGAPTSRSSRVEDVLLIAGDRQEPGRTC